MFSISAINDTNSRAQWEPLAPTKEAQEFYLSQTYHEGLLKLQAKDYVKARELLEAVLKDPLVSSSQVKNSASDGHLLQLRFLSLKNLATVFLQQGSMHYENALHCYLQAVEIDATDTLVWKQLGRLSCSMGLLSTSRWAFEQGLLCSPNNWNCMEELLEVLVAIGDEVACISIADLILRHWPSHSRALHVKNTIEDAHPLPFKPRGIDKLEPEHEKLNFAGKRKATDYEIDENAKLKSTNQNIELELSGATWAVLADAILGILSQGSRNASDARYVLDHTNVFNEKVAKNAISGDAMAEVENLKPEKHEKMGRHTDSKIDIRIPSSSEIIMNPSDGKGKGVCPSGETSPLISYGFEKTSTVKEKEISMDKEHPQERRSTRLERLRSLKSGKEELEDAGGKDPRKIVFQFLEPFVLNRPKAQIDGSSDNSNGPYGNLTYSSALEYTDVVRFISGVSRNFGAYHIGHLLLEEVAHLKIPFQDSFVKFLELEKLLRYGCQDRTPLCSLFLAELYYYQGSWSANESNRLELFSEASFHLCKVIESVVFDYPYDLVGNALRAVEMSNLNGVRNLMDCTAGDGNMTLTDSSQNTAAPSQGHSGQKPTFIDNIAFWVRFFWLSGHLSLSSGCKEKAFNEFSICLSLLGNSKKSEETPGAIFLPNSKFVRALTADRILHELNLLKLTAIVGKTADEMIEKGMYSKCVNMLAPLLLSNKDDCFDAVSGFSNESGSLTSVEISAFNVLMLACEKEEPVNIEVYMRCHWRKLQLLTLSGRTVDFALQQKDKSLLAVTNTASDLDAAEAASRHWIQMVVQEVKDISRSASRVKNLIDQCDNYDGVNSLVCIIGDIQSLLLTIMSSVVQKILSQKFSGSELGQLESWCLVDATIAFCKLQHLDFSVPVKTQVDLIVAVHDVLAEYGLCCAGRDNEGEEGSFLKFSIKHLLALDVKLKSINGINGKDESLSLHKDAPEDTIPEYLLAMTQGEQAKEEKELDIEKNATDATLDSAREESQKNVIADTDTTDATLDSAREESQKNVIADTDATDATLDSTREENQKNAFADTVNLPIDLEAEEVELGIENALDQCFFCLYGLKINPDPSSEDDLAMHKNTSRGDYQTKEQCADVFQYILPYAGALSRAGLVKLRRVLRAIRKHFPQPPPEILAESVIDKLLDSSDFCEDKLCELSGYDGNREYIMNILFSNGRGPEAFKSSVVGSEPYLEVYGNLYYLIALAEETSATDKYPGFVLKKEGEEFVEHNANLFKYDLLYNPLRFESWQKLANIYDEEVDLLLNDGSKHINVVDWRKSTTLPQRVEIGRRRSRRCLLMSLALARTPVQQSQIHELLALVYYDNLQNVVPFYDQRSVIPTKDAVWTKFCRNSMKYFEKAFALRPDWLHAFYLGKLCEKMGYSSVKAFSYYNKAACLNPSAVDPVYRMHASRLKLLYTKGKKNLYILQIIAAYAFNQSTKETIVKMFNWASQDLMQLTLDVKDLGASDDPNSRKDIEPSILDAAWKLLFDDCLSALEVCVEGDLKHFHKARYMLARGLHKRGEDGDLARAKDELSFCFKSSRSCFTINMWEIDGMTKRGRRKNPSLGGNRRNLEVSLSESSRKFITCMRKYALFYLHLLEKTRDLGTLEKAYTYLRTDKRFALCIGDIVPIALGKYIQVLVSSIHHAEATESTSLEQMLERMFNIFMDHVNFYADISSSPEVNNNPELSESSLYGYIHQYIQLLERDVRLDALEGMNERIKKRFKNPKLSSINFAKICRHVSLAWCRVILIKLVSITVLPDAGSPNGIQLFVDLCPDEFEGLAHSTLDVSHKQALSKIKNTRVWQSSDQNMEAAVALMRCAYNFYRESSSGTLPSGINLYTVLPTEGLQQPNKEFLDLSIPRKLLLWAHTLVHGRYSSISSVVKYCEENAKARLRRGNVVSTAAALPSTPSGHNHAVGEREVVDAPSVVAAPATDERQISLKLGRCNASRTETDQEE